MAAPRPSYLLLALLLPIFAVAPLLYPGYIQTHAGFIPLWNLIDLRANLGQLGWLPHLYVQFDPLRSDGLLAYYLAALLPLGPAAAVKAVLGLSWLLGSLGLYLWLRSWLGQPGGLIAALVYTYLPYRLAAVYVRGAWGEALFWGLLPWALLAATYLVAAPRPVLLLPAAFIWLLLGLSQLGLTLWAFVFLLALLLAFHRARALLPAGAALLGSLVAAGLVLALAGGPGPASETFAGHLLYPFQLFSAYWGAGPSRAGWDDGLSFQLGLAALGLASVGVALWRGREGPPDRRPGFFLAAALLLSLLTLTPAGLFWRLPLSASLAYPWQLLGLAGLSLAVLAGTITWLEPDLAGLPLFGSLVIVVLLSSYGYLAPTFIQAGPYIEAGPEAELGPARLVVLDHDLAVAINGNTAGLAARQGSTTIPLAAYGPLRPDDTLVLAVTWQPLQAFDQDLKIFVHLVDAGGQVLTQYDGYPGQGDYPTSRWVPGELIEETYPLRLPAGAPPGPYRLYLGLYDETTLARLPVAGGAEGRVIIDVQ